MTAALTQFSLQHIHVVLGHFKGLITLCDQNVIIIPSKASWIKNRVLIIMFAFIYLLVLKKFSILKENFMSYWSTYEKTLIVHNLNRVLSHIRKSWKKASNQILEPQNKLSYLMPTASSSQTWRRDSKEKFRPFSTIQKFFMLNHRIVWRVLLSCKEVIFLSPFVF